MEEIEVPTEHLHENIKEKLEEKGEKKESWSMYLAISTALMAVFAALGSLFAGHHSNEALISQIKASDSWNYYQAKGIKYEIASLMTEIKSSDSVVANLREKMKEYKKEQADIQKEANAAVKESEFHLAKHVTLARSVTIFQISIAISAIAMLTGRKPLWYASLAFSVMGLVLFFMGVF
jgi:chromosome segregation ATPase